MFELHKDIYQDILSTLPDPRCMELGDFYRFDLLVQPFDSIQEAMVAMRSRTVKAQTIWWECRELESFSDRAKYWALRSELKLI